MDIKKVVLDLNDELIELRRDFHKYPELGLKEFKTSKKIKSYLDRLGLKTRFCGGTGVIGVLEGELDGKVVMLRSDMDALPIEEKTGLPFSSTNKGVMHACGHDAHMAMLLIAAKVLSENKTAIKGKVVFLFQTNEEEAGAELMINDGALENPKPDAVFGMHIWGYTPKGKVGIINGPIMASSYYFKIILKGVGGHGGAPHKAINPIDAAGNILTAVNTFKSTEIDALDPTVISFGMIHAGNKEIVIPETLEMQGSIRCIHRNDEHIRNRFADIVNSVAKANRCSADIEFVCGNTLLDNDEKIADIVRKSTSETLGKENIISEGVETMLGEDFAEFTRRIPGAFCFLGIGDETKGVEREHHNPKFDIDEDVLKDGVELHIRNALNFLNGDYNEE